MNEIEPNSKFNKLTVIEFDKKKHKYKCLCDCGNITYVTGYKIKSGHTKSCGCHRIENGKNNKIHGYYNKRIYFEWKNMIYRCYKEKYPYYKYYGGRGIKVCNEWLDINNFAKWAECNNYNDNLTLDRIDTNGDYCPENCRWVTMHEQMRNTRKTIKIKYNGEIFCLTDLCKKLNINREAVRGLKIRRNISYEDAIKIKTTMRFNAHKQKWEKK